MVIYNDTKFLYPKFGRAVRKLHAYLIDSHETGRTKTRFEIFETYRDPLRQTDLFNKKVSKAGPFESAHQLGLATDFVPYLSPDEAIALGKVKGEKVLPGWNWDPSHDYSFLAAAAKLHNLEVPITWDPCHVEHPSWRKARLEFRRLFD